MTAILLFFILTAVFAALLDRDDAGRPTRDPDSLRSIVLTHMRERDGSSGTDRAHTLFLQLFDRVYGHRMWSAHRFGASVLSTLVGLVVVVVGIGPSNTALGTVVETLLSFRNEIIAADSDSAVSVRYINAFFGLLTPPIAVIFLMPVNFFADYFSLAETRLLLHLGRGRGVAALIGLMCLDLVLTALIFLLPVVALGYFLGGVGGATSLVDLVSTVELGFPFFLTTFVTSFAWILFACCAMAIRMMAYWSLGKRIVEEMSKAARPTVAHTFVAYIVFLLLWVPINMGAVRWWPRELALQPDGEPTPIVLERTYRAFFRAATARYRVAFPGEEGVTYRIETTPVITSDTVITLLVDGREVDEDDDGGNAGGSLITYTSEASGTHVVEIVPWMGIDPDVRDAALDSAAAIGPAYVFDFSVREVDAGEAEEGGTQDDELVAFLVALSDSDDALDRRIAAGSMGTPLEALTRLTGDPVFEVRARVAGNRNTPEEILRRLGGDPAADVRAAVAGNENTPVGVLGGLVEDGSWLVRMEVAENENASAGNLLMLAEDVSAMVRAAVGMNIGAPDEALGALAGDGDGSVRRAVAQNEATETDVLRQLSEDLDSRVRQGVAGNANAPDEVLEELAADASSGVRGSVASNVVVSEAVLGLLAADPETDVRMQVARNLRTPASVLSGLAGDADIEVRRAVAMNRSSPAAALATLENDDDEVVSTAVRN